MMKRTSKNVITNEKLELVLSSVMSLQTDPQFAELVVPIIERTSEVSLRTLEYFVISYSKKFRVSYRVSDQRLVFYYPDYKAYLTSFPKKLFDPFRRSDDEEKIRFAYGIDGKTVDTTVGQLNFFKWALQFKVIEYVKAHLSEIQSDMKKSKQKSGSVPQSSHRKKRKQTHEEWPIHGMDSPSIPSQSWYASPSDPDS